MSTSTAINGALTLASFTNSDFQANTTCKLYNNVTIPVGTNNFLFYAEGGASSEAYTTAQNGTLKSSNFDDATSISAINFSLVPIKAEATTATQTTLLGIMNAVAGAKLSDTTYWSSYVSSTDAVEKALGGYYTAFIGTKAGSATAIFNTLKILYDNLSGSTYTSNAMATAIKTAITSSQYIETDGTSIKWADAAASIKTYPESEGLPQGAYALTWESNAFKYAPSNEIGTGDAAIANASKMCYPSSLYYWIDTPLWATDDDKSSGFTWPAASSWESIDNSGASTSFPSWGTTVLATTQTIALKENIQYAVAQLATTVKLTANKLKDKADTEITIPDAGLTITGVLVGAQPATVQYDFRAASNLTDFANSIYDSAVPSNWAATTSDPSTTNYTLVLDNEKTGTSQDKVPVAIEFVNTASVSFEAIDGIVYPGQRFYIVGQLDVNNTTTGAVTNTNSLTHVFVQDYVTKANFTVSTLAKSYVTIPDLRAPQMLLGLSVDLTWKEGITFNVEIAAD